MCRLVVCLLFICFFQNGIKLSMQDDPTTEAPATTPTEEPKKSNSSESINKSSKESTTESGQTTDDEVRRGNYAGTDIDSDMEYTTKKIRAGTIMENLEPPMTLRPKPKSKGTPKVADEIDYQSKLMELQEKITKAVAKGVEGAKEMADGAYNFLRDTVTGIFK
ncbi:uncharacterized protein LOC113500128 [Trichoplusia ni]|uniref:Uncharacterized protein LOC113500128 n=1 Tax=Trichoplusia ni TaxID=7111 RepID=A0A7E5W8S8_TRINI|nr:uncharacterized protein LOC113500128 [Trichoplusia ni]